MGHRDAGISEPADPRSDPRHNPERDRGLGQSQRFLAAAAEDAGVAAFQPQHPPPLSRQPDQPGRDVGLAWRRASAALAGIVELHAVRRQGQDARIDKRVVDDDIGAVERMQGQGGEEPGVARPRSNQPNAARREIR